MKTAFVFACLGFVCAFYCLKFDWLFAKLLLGSLALCWLGVALAYAGLGAKTFGKQTNGCLSLWSALFWPYHLLNELTLRSLRRGTKENTFDSIDNHILLGCKLAPRDERKLLEHDVCSVLDLTCEFAETPFLRALNYRSIPVLDSRAPTVRQLCEGADFIAENAKEEVVYVHCALGHGRSALFVAAYLLRVGRARNAEEAVELVRQKRANIELSRQQLALLQEFAARELGS